MREVPLGIVAAVPEGTIEEAQRIFRDSWELSNLTHVAKYLILSRFAVQLSTVPDQAPFLLASWIDRRLDLFERFCVPSVLSQTDSNFEWIAALDPRIPEQVAAKMVDIARGRLRVLRVDGEDDFARQVDARIRAEGRAVVSSRLDTDDALALDFVRTVREAIRPGEVLNFPDGAALDLVSGRIRQKVMPSNPFVSYFGEKSVLSLGGHSRASSCRGYRELKTRQPMWLQVMHEGNLKNRMPRIGRPMQQSTLPGIFAVDHSGAADSKWLGHAQQVEYRALSVARGTANFMRQLLRRP